MKTNDALFQLVQKSQKLLLASQSRKGPFTPETNALIRGMFFRIKDNLSVDYCRQIEIKDIEIEVLDSLITKYIKSGEDNFNSHFIQLLCWNIHKIKPITTRNKKGRVIHESFFEFQPGIFDLSPITKKLFRLLTNHNDCKERISAALMMVYLNHYTKASSYFIESLKHYLKSIHFSRNLNIFFDVNHAGTYGRWRIYSSYYKSFLRRMDFFQIRSAYFNTKYFQDAWYFWMKKNASPLNEAVIEDLPCRYYDICTDAEKLLILSRLIVSNYKNGRDIKELYTDHLQDLFPINPNIPENWLFETNIKDIIRLIEASNIFQQTFMQKKELLRYELNNNEIKIYRYEVS